MFFENIFSTNTIYIILLIFFALFLIAFMIRKTKRYNEHREFSKCESPIEQQLFRAIRDNLQDEKNRRMRVYTQVPCGYYRIDLAVYSKHRKIAIECDGKAYHSSPEQIAHDRKKDIFLRKNGWDVLRFTGSEIYNNADECTKVIERLYYKKKSLFRRFFRF